jgi:hypothetical protein
LGLVAVATEYRKFQRPFAGAMLLLYAAAAVVYLIAAMSPGTAVAGRAGVFRA